MSSQPNPRRTTPPGSDTAAIDPRIWLALAYLVAAAVWLDGLWHGFREPFLIQDDARHFVVFMQRWMDPDLFPGDLYADYYLSIVPYGFKAVYWLLAQVGIDPLLANKLLPPVLGMALVHFSFLLGRRLTGSAMGGFFVAVSETLLIATASSLGSGVPRAFAPPLLIAFLVALLDRRPLATALAVALLAMVYPQVALLALAILGLSPIRWKQGRPRLMLDRRHLAPVIVGGLAGLAALAPFILAADTYGPALDRAVALSMPNMRPPGAGAFFYDDPVFFYLCSKRAGILPLHGFCRDLFRDAPSWGPLVPSFFLAAIVAMAVALRIYASRPGAAVRPQVGILLTVLAAGAILYAAAHVLLFELHLPSRYSNTAIGIVSRVSVGLILAFAATLLLRRLAVRARPLRAAVAGALAAALAALAPLFGGFPYMHYERAPSPPLYAAIATLPKDAMIATLSGEAIYIPAFARRSVLYASEFAVPYSFGFYRTVIDRAEAIIRAQYAPSLAPLRDLADTYGVTHILLDAQAFDPAYMANRKSLLYPAAAADAEARLTAGAPPALAAAASDACTVHASPRHRLLDLACLLDGAT